MQNEWKFQEFSSSVLGRRQHSFFISNVNINLFWLKSATPDISSNFYCTLKFSIFRWTMSIPVNHKTVFVLDHSSFFNQSCNQSVDYDILGKGKTPGIIPAAPIFKSLWTCSVETMMEYIRVVYDIYPTSKLVSTKLILLFDRLRGVSQECQHVGRLIVKKKTIVFLL